MLTLIFIGIQGKKDNTTIIDPRIINNNINHIRTMIIGNTNHTKGKYKSQNMNWKTHSIDRQWPHMSQKRLALKMVEELHAMIEH